MYRIFVVLLLMSCTFDEGVMYMPAPMLGSIGDPCRTNEDCASNLCRQEHRGWVLPEGMCTEVCVFNTPCSYGYCVFDGEDALCYPPCGLRCREGWVCYGIIGIQLCIPGTSSISRYNVAPRGT